jgi:predicted alpha-1,2-mannosidase
MNLSGATEVAGNRNYADLVEPRVGTTQTRWIHFSSACRPFGMVSLSPDTRINGDWGCGYVYDDGQIVGFSHAHDWQIGAVLVMPVSGDVTPCGGVENFTSPFSHGAEVVKPGDHRVLLQRYNIGVELTATLRVGLHRYTFPENQNAAILIDLASTLGPSTMGEGVLRQVAPRRLEGFIDNLPTIRRPKPLRVYFAIELDHDFTLESFQNDELCGVVSSIEGEDIRARLALGQVEKPVAMKVALSYTSSAAAWHNLLMEVGDRDFDTVRKEARDEWNTWLGRIHVEGSDTERRARFYTDLFFALAGRRTFSDYAGTYIDNTGDAPVVRQIPLNDSGQPKYRHFNSDSFWGAQWSIIPLWSLAYPEIIEQFCHCFLDYHRNGGLIPRGPAGGHYTFVMTSAQSTPLFVSAILQGIVRFEDIEEVYEALRKNHMPGGLMSKCGYEHETCLGGGIEDYMTLGFIPEDLPAVGGGHNNGAAQTLEHAYNDWCLSQLASTLGKTQDAELFAKRAQNYRNLFDAEIGFMRPRNRDGSWFEPYDPFSKKGWTEGGGWNYTFYVPHDVAGLIQCFGSEKAFFDKLEEALCLSQTKGFKAPHGRHHETSLDFGNEPPLAVPFLFHVAGKPDRTEYWLQQIYQTLKCGNSPRDGFGGDEDQGMMGAWNVLVALGLFSIDGACGQTSTYQITTPIFDRIVIQRGASCGDGDVLEIVVSKSSDSMQTVESIEMDGVAMSNRQITYQQFKSCRKMLVRAH